MSREHLRIKIDNEVLKLKDPKVRRLLSGQISFSAFALTVQPGEPYVLIKDTIYALTEQEFYALRSVLPVNVMTDKLFKYVLDCPEVAGMHEKDRQFLAKVKEELPTCPACRYKRYKDEVYKLVKAYNIKVPVELAQASGVRSDNAEYPETEAEVVPKVFPLLSGMYKLPYEQRKACIDCVEKHLSQAWVLAHEALQGYPEYASIVVGHLGEALAEMPEELSALRSTVEFCLARTNYTGVPFVPLLLIAPMLTHARAQLDVNWADRKDTDTSAGIFELAMDDSMLRDIADAVVNTPGLGTRLKAECQRVDNFILGVEKGVGEGPRLGWEGAMGTLADSLADVSPKLAAVIRNRRLLFAAAPEMTRPSGYTLDGLEKTLDKYTTR